jgi:Xaa-Pro dipeptidase
MPVGGVRIEDDILITYCGYENLTTAPKGDAMLEIIRNGRNSAVDLSDPGFTPSRGLDSDIEPVLRRAPGISKKTPPQHLHKPLTRATTLPADFQQQHATSFEPFAGPSLVSISSHPMTMEEKIQQWQYKRRSVETVPCPARNMKKLQPVCGELSSNVQHVYMSNAPDLASLSRSNPELGSAPNCKNCAILVQTLDRLRQNLTPSTQKSLKPVVKIDPRGKNTTPLCDEAPPAAPQIDELSVGASACTVNLDKRQRIMLPPAQSIPVGSTVEREARCAIGYGAAPLAHAIRSRAASGQVMQPHVKREQSATKANPLSPSHPIPTANTSPILPKLPKLPKLRHSRKLPDPLPSTEALEAEATRQKLEALQLRLDSLEERARVKKRQQDHTILPERFLASRPSMPVLMSHNPWQQHSIPPHPTEKRGLCNRRSTHIGGLDIDVSRLGRQEEGEQQRRFERDALTRDTFFLR